MSTVLERMVTRARGALPSVEPLIPPHFADSRGLPPDALAIRDTGLASQHYHGSSPSSAAAPVSIPAYGTDQVAAEEPGTSEQVPRPYRARLHNGQAGYSSTAAASTPGMPPVSGTNEARPDTSPSPRSGPGAASDATVWSTPHDQSAHQAAPGGSGAGGTSAHAHPSHDMPATHVTPALPATLRPPVPGTAQGAADSVLPETAGQAGSSAEPAEVAEPVNVVEGRGPGQGAGSPGITITIGHIEVRPAPPPSQGPQRERPQFRPRVSLGDFLGHGADGSR